MNAKALRLITITAAVALTSLGTVSAAQAQGADDTAPQVQSSASATPGADDATPHVSGADDATPHVSGVDDSVTGAKSASASSSSTSHRHGAKPKHKAGKRHSGVHTAAHK